MARLRRGCRLVGVGWGVGVDGLVEETCYLFGKFSLDEFTVLWFFVVSGASLLCHEPPKRAQFLRLH